MEFPVIDCQQVTSHLASMGGRPIRRSDFLDRVTLLVDQPPPDWSRVTPEFPE